MIIKVVHAALFFCLKLIIAINQQDDKPLLGMTVPVEVSIVKTASTHELNISAPSDDNIAPCVRYRTAESNDPTGQQDVAEDIQIPPSILLLTKRYPETKVLIQYYKEINKDPDYYSRKIDISEDLATDDVPLFLQWDKRWAFLNYGRHTMIASSGCAPTCLSMALCYFKIGDALNPKAIADFSYENGYYVEYCGTYSSLFTSGAAAFGLKSREIEKNQITMQKNLDDGKLIVALMDYGHFTKNGHYILIKNYDNDGNFLVNDPNSLINSTHAWKPEVIIGEARNLWALSF